MGGVGAPRLLREAADWSHLWRIAAVNLPKLQTLLSLAARGYWLVSPTCGRLW